MDINDFDLNSSITKLYDNTKGDKDSSWKKKLIIGSIIGLILIIILVVILIFIRSKNEDNKYTENDVVADIKCIFDIRDISKSTNILGEEFEKESNEFDIFIGKDRIKYSKNYKFSSIGNKEIVFKIYKEINMDYMFKNVSSLTSAILFSSQNTLILSMKSTFENCINLNHFTISGFNTRMIKSVSRLFYNDINLISLVLNDFTTSNIEDMSYILS